MWCSSAIAVCETPSTSQNQMSEWPFPIVQVCMIAPKGVNCGCENYVAPAGDVSASTDTSVVGIVANQSALTAAVASPPSLTSAAQNATGGTNGLQRACSQACQFLMSTCGVQAVLHAHAHMAVTITLPLATALLLSPHMWPCREPGRLVHAVCGARLRARHDAAGVRAGHPQAPVDQPIWQAQGASICHRPVVRGAEQQTQRILLHLTDAPAIEVRNTA